MTIETPHSKEYYERITLYNKLIGKMLHENESVSLNVFWFLGKNLGCIANLTKHFSSITLL